MLDSLHLKGKNPPETLGINAKSFDAETNANNIWTMEEKYEWDENKRKENLIKHGVDFSAVYDFDWYTASVTLDHRNDELRFVAYGFISERLHVIVYTERGSSTRIISLRKANRREVRRYEQR